MSLLDSLGLRSQADALQAQYPDMPAGLLDAQVQQEGGVTASGVAITNSSGHTGLAQTSASTAAQPGYGVTPLADPTNASASLTFMAQYDAGLAAANGGDYDAALAKYSGGAYTASSLLGSSATTGTTLVSGGNGDTLFAGTGAGTNNVGNGGDTLFVGSGTTDDSSGDLVQTPSVSAASIAAGGLQVDTNDANSAATSLRSAAGSASAEAGTLSGFVTWLENQVARIAVICLGITIIVLALYLIATGQSPSKGLQSIRLNVFRNVRSSAAAT